MLKMDNTLVLMIGTMMVQSSRAKGKRVLFLQAISYEKLLLLCEAKVPECGGYDEFISKKRTNHGIRKLQTEG